MIENEKGESEKGSLKWIQKVINDRPQILEAELRKCFSIPSTISFRWSSPLREKNFAEYLEQRDALKILSIQAIEASILEF